MAPRRSARRPVAAIVTVVALATCLALTSTTQSAIPAAAADIATLSDQRYGTAVADLADVYRPAGSGSHPAILLIHGGGWHSGSKGGWADRARDLVAAGFVAVAVNYTLVTDSVPGFPRQLHELKQAVAWLRTNAARFHLDPARIGALGSSSGGNLAAMLALDGWGPLTSGNRIAAVVTWSALLDLTTQPGLSKSIPEYVGCDPDARDCTAVLADASPLHHVSSDDPPIELFNSTRELVPLRTVEQMDARLTQVGVTHTVVVYDGDKHGTSYADTAMPATIAYFTTHLG